MSNKVSLCLLACVLSLQMLFWLVISKMDFRHGRTTFAKPSACHGNASLEGWVCTIGGIAYRCASVPGKSVDTPQVVAPSKCIVGRVGLHYWRDSVQMRICARKERGHATGCCSIQILSKRLGKLGSLLRGRFFVPSRHQRCAGQVFTAYESSREQELERIRVGGQ
jgi:hypothetical protein